MKKETYEKFLRSIGFMQDEFIEMISEHKVPPDRLCSWCKKNYCHKPECWQEYFDEVFEDHGT